MTCLRSILVAALLLPSPACVSNTIDLETMTDGSGSGDDVATPEGTSTGSATLPTTATATSPTTATDTSPTTTSPTTATTSVSDTATADSADETFGIPLDVGPLPEDPQTLLLAIDSVLSPGLPIQGIVWLDPSTPDTVDLTLQWLSLDVGSTTEPRELVGDVYAYPGIPLAPDGTLLWQTGVILVPGEANPITGSDVVLSAELLVTPEAAPFCGTVSGEITSPIQAPLDGSTHAMTWVPSEHELPLEFLSACP